MEEHLDQIEEVCKISDERYDRQKRIPWWDQKVLLTAHIFVVGAGALGNEVCKNLALLGIGEVTLVDNDIIEESNLSRSILMRGQDRGKNKANVIACNMKEINSKMKINPVNCNVIYQYGSGNYRNFNLVMMAVDNLEARLWINRYCFMWGIPLIDGGLNGLTCTIQVMMPPKPPCYECSFTSDHYRSINRRYSCDGLKRNIAEGKIATVITSAAICAGFMTQEAVKILHGLNSGISGKRLTIDGNSNNFSLTDVANRKDCLGHQSILDDIIYLPYSSNTKVIDLKRAIINYLGCKNIEIEHDKSILYEMTCPVCGTKEKKMSLAAMVPEDDLICRQCGGFLNTYTSGTLEKDNATLADHCVPENHVLRVYLSDGQCKYLAQRDCISPIEKGLDKRKHQV